MSEDRDQAAKEAAELLPCVCDGVQFDGDKWNEWHPKTCPASRRPAVAEALRKREYALLLCQGELNLAFDVQADLKAELGIAVQTIAEWREAVDDLRAQLEGMTNQVDLYATGEAEAKRDAIETRRQLATAQEWREKYEDAQKQLVAYERRLKEYEQHDLRNS
jgi:hypothetical protein